MIIFCKVVSCGAIHSYYSCVYIFLVANETLLIYRGEERDGDKISKPELKSHFQDIFLLSRFITNLHN